MSAQEHDVESRTSDICCASADEVDFAVSPGELLQAQRAAYIDHRHGERDRDSLGELVHCAYLHNCRETGCCRPKPFNVDGLRMTIRAPESAP